jgi:tungstate transport system substrate-binding protein
MILRAVPVPLVALMVFSVAACGGRDEVILATTTSTQDSGLLDVLAPVFEEESGYRLKVVAVGSGQAMRLGEEGEADVLLVHSPEAEEAFMREGHGIERRPVMYNDFIIAGPPGDPAGIRGLTDAAGAFRRIHEAGAVFLSRGDNSGTHARERAIWRLAGIEPGGAGYQETGVGMGATLTIAGEKRGYTLADRGTFLAQQRNLELEVLVEGDPQLTNPYSVILVDAAKHGRINEAGARAFAGFITSPRGQALIREFRFNEFGRPLFIPGTPSLASPAGERR